MSHVICLTSRSLTKHCAWISSHSLQFLCLSHISCLYSTNVCAWNNNNHTENEKTFLTNSPSPPLILGGGRNKPSKELSGARRMQREVGDGMVALHSTDRAKNAVPWMLNWPKAFSDIKFKKWKIIYFPPPPNCCSFLVTSTNSRSNRDLKTPCPFFCQTFDINFVFISPLYTNDFPFIPYTHISLNAFC